jgi:hypothetical protein
MSDDSAPRPPARAPGGDAAPQRAETAPAKSAVGKTAAAESAGGLAALVQSARGLWAADFDLGRVGMAISVPVLCWVFYTTSSGMVDIMQKEAGDWIGLIGTVVATTAVLVMLASTSWSLGADLAALIARRRMARERVVVKTFVTAAVFLFVFTISAFFSFTYYYNNIFKLSSRKIVSELQPMELAAEIVLPAAKEIGERYDAESARIAASPAFKAYLDSLDGLLDTARKAGPALRDAIRKSQEAQQQIAAQAARQAASELDAAQAASRQLDEQRERVAALNRNVADLDAIIKAKQDEMATLASAARQEEQLAVDASKGLDGLGASCGPNCLSHRVKANEATRRAATIRQTLVAPTTERDAAIRRRDALNAQAITLRQKAEAGSASARRPTPKLEAALDLSAVLHDLAQSRDQIRVDPNWRNVREAKPLCEPILAASRQSSAAPALIAPDFACEPQAEARDLLSARDDVIAGRAVFDQKCSLEGALRDDISAITARIRAAPASETAAAATGFTEAKKLVDACVVAGKTAGLNEMDVRGLLKKSDAFLRAHTTERNKFELAREAFWSFTPDSTMAIFVAMAQDAFVFIMKFLSEIFKRGFEARERRQFAAPMDLTDGEAEPVETRAMKALMRAARPVHGDMSEIDPDTPTIAVLPINVRENLIALLNRLVRDEIAHVDRKGFYVVDNITVSQVESRLYASMRPRALARALRAAGERGLEGADGPKNYYGDLAGEVKRRRRPSALERYLIPEAAPMEAGAPSRA